MRDDCPCKEEVEKEEATALAQAIERSFAQQVALPHVPGLTSEESEVLTIRCEEEVSDRTSPGIPMILNYVSNQCH